MNQFPRITGMALLMAALLCTGAHAQSSMPKTREEVRRELAEAVRNGTIAQGELGLAPRDLFPQNYPAPAQVAGRSRADVRAELEAARASGELLATGESAQKLNELFPSRYPQRSVVAGKTRAEVQAELAEARRTGDVLAAGESGLTLKEIYPGRYPLAAAPVYAGTDAGQPVRR